MASDKYEKSYEYLDLSGYLLYDYVHNYLKYAGNPICNHLNKFLEEQILNILNIDNSLIPDTIDNLTTFTLYDIIYPNAHYIYNVKDKNFCLPIVCRFWGGFIRRNVLQYQQNATQEFYKTYKLKR